MDGSIRWWANWCGPTSGLTRQVPPLGTSSLWFGTYRHTPPTKGAKRVFELEKRGLSMQNGPANRLVLHPGAKRKHDKEWVNSPARGSRRKASAHRPN